MEKLSVNSNILVFLIFFKAKWKQNTTYTEIKQDYD